MAWLLDASADPGQAGLGHTLHDCLFTSNALDQGRAGVAVI
jgi:hypothetical protein